MKEKLNLKDLAHDHRQAYGENNVEEMTEKQKANAAFAEASPAFFHPMTSSCSLWIITDVEAVKIWRILW